MICFSDPLFGVGLGPSGCWVLFWVGITVRLICSYDFELSKQNLPVLVLMNLHR